MSQQQVDELTERLHWMERRLEAAEQLGAEAMRRVVQLEEETDESNESLEEALEATLATIRLRRR